MFEAGWRIVGEHSDALARTMSARWLLSQSDQMNDLPQSNERTTELTDALVLLGLECFLMRPFALNVLPLANIVRIDRRIHRRCRPGCLCGYHWTKWVLREPPNQSLTRFRLDRKGEDELRIELLGRAAILD